MARRRDVSPVLDTAFEKMRPSNEGSSL
jgi:hypothetical protein